MPFNLCVKNDVLFTKNASVVVCSHFGYLLICLVITDYFFMVVNELVPYKL